MEMIFFETRTVWISKMKIIFSNFLFNKLKKEGKHPLLLQTDKQMMGKVNSRRKKIGGCQYRGA